MFVRLFQSGRKYIFAVSKIIKKLKKLSFMKKGKYIDYNIMLACLSHRKAQVNQQADIHQQLAETLSERRNLFEKYKAVFENAVPDIHQQLLQTISEYELNRQYLQRSISRVQHAA